ncbi:hypothetical protein AAK979_10765, partial [Ileibacterium valens]|uniref:hypothetical protein n=1 Tax=Ileibacterium valens TaxID=1862668 RepID=UPI003511D4F9
PPVLVEYRISTGTGGSKPVQISKGYGTQEKWITDDPFKKLVHWQLRIRYPHKVLKPQKSPN